MEKHVKHPIDELFSKKLNEPQPEADNLLWQQVEASMQKKDKNRWLILLMLLLLLAGGVSTYYVLNGNSGKHAVIAQSEENDSKITTNNSTPQQTITSSNSTNQIVNGLTSSGSANKTANNLGSEKIRNININTQANRHNRITPNYTVKNNNITKEIFPPSISKTDSELPDNNLPVQTIKKQDLDISDNLAGNRDSINQFTSPENTISQKDVVKKKQIVKKRTKWFAEAGVSYLENLHIATAKSSQYYTKRRAAEEKPFPALNYSLKGGVVLKRFEIISGITVINFGEKIKYENKGLLYSKDSINPAVVENDAITLKNGSYKNTYLGIPIKIAYLIPLKSVKVELGGGVDVAFPLTWNSYYLNKQIDGLENPGNLNMLSKTVLDINLFGGIAIPVWQNFDFLAAIDYRRNLNSVLKKDYAVKQQYIGLGGEAGLRYNFR